MQPIDPFGPLIEHLGIFAGAVTNPATAGLVGLLALLVRQYPPFLAAVALIGAGDAAFEAFLIGPHAPLISALVLGAAAALVQGWCLWTCVQFMRRLRHAVRRRIALFRSRQP